MADVHALTVVLEKGVSADYAERLAEAIALMGGVG